LPKPSSSSGGGTSTGKCYIYEQTRHFAQQCPNKKPAGGAPTKKPVGEQPRSPGRVFALTSTEAT